MKDVYTGVFEALGSRITVWYLPSLVGVTLYSFFVFPEVEPDFAVYQRITAELSPTQRVFLIAFVGLIVAIVAQALTRPLYRLLEGYYWPEKLGRTRRTQSFINKRDKLIEGARSNPDLGRLAEKLRMYPADDSSFLPTTLGNSLRASEHYGTDRYGLDVATLWHRIFPLASEELRELLRVTRDAMDRWISAYAVALLFLIATAVSGSRDQVWLALLIGLLTIPIWYWLAVRASADYGQALRALADTARVDLAASLGLDLPLTRAEEKTLWTAVTGAAAWSSVPPKGDGSPLFPKIDDWHLTIDRARLDSSLESPLESGASQNGDGTWSWQIVGVRHEVVARSGGDGFNSEEECLAALSSFLNGVRRIEVAD